MHLQFLKEGHVWTIAHQGEHFIAFDGFLLLICICFFPSGKCCSDSLPGALPTRNPVAPTELERLRRVGEPAIGSISELFAEGKRVLLDRAD